MRPVPCSRNQLSHHNSKSLQHTGMHRPHGLQILFCILTVTTVLCSASTERYVRGRCSSVLYFMVRSIQESGSSSSWTLTGQAWSNQNPLTWHLMQQQTWCICIPHVCRKQELFSIPQSIEFVVWHPWLHHNHTIILQTFSQCCQVFLSSATMGFFFFLKSFANLMRLLGFFLFFEDWNVAVPWVSWVGMGVSWWPLPRCHPGQLPKSLGVDSVENWSSM